MFGRIILFLCQVSVFLFLLTERKIKTFYFSNLGHRSLKSPDFIDQFNRMSDDDQCAVRALVSDWAFCSEKIMHGNPSGLDNTICAFGGLVKFYRNQKPTPLKSVKALNILLIDSCVSRSTAAMVERVLKQKTDDPTQVQAVFDKIEAIVDQVAEVKRLRIRLNKTKFKQNIFQILEDESLPTRFVQLSELFSQNNQLLAELNVSHKELDNIRNVCSRYGLSSKLTGAGGGGLVLRNV